MRLFGACGCVVYSYVCLSVCVSVENPIFYAYAIWWRNTRNIDKFIVCNCILNVYYIFLRFVFCVTQTFLYSLVRLVEMSVVCRRTHHPVRFFFHENNAFYYFNKFLTEYKYANIKKSNINQYLRNINAAFSDKWTFMGRGKANFHYGFSLLYKTHFLCVN